MKQVQMSHSVPVAQLGDQWISLKSYCEAAFSTKHYRDKIFACAGQVLCHMQMIVR